MQFTFSFIVSMFKLLSVEAVEALVLKLYFNDNSAISLIPTQCAAGKAAILAFPCRHSSRPPLRPRRGPLRASRSTTPFLRHLDTTRTATIPATTSASASTPSTVLYPFPTKNKAGLQFIHLILSSCLRVA